MSESRRSCSRHVCARTEASGELCAPVKGAEGGCGDRCERVSKPAVPNEARASRVGTFAGEAGNGEAQGCSKSSSQELKG